MKKDTENTRPVSDGTDDGEEGELTEQEKLMYQMIWGLNWDEQFPSKGNKTKSK